MEGTFFVENVSKKLNRLAREQTKERILRDILLDMQICVFEGWDILEYTNEIIHLLTEISHENHRGKEVNHDRH